jgi:hypothetical protein
MRVGAATACFYPHSLVVSVANKPLICTTAELVRDVPFVMAQHLQYRNTGRDAMIAILQFVTLIITTMFAAVAAVLLNWVLLRAAFQLMRPATAGQTAARIQLVPGTLR